MDGDQGGVSDMPSTVALFVIAILVLGACGGSEETAAPSRSPSPATLGGTTLPSPAVSCTIAFAVTAGMEISDFCVVSTDGTGLRQLTDDPQGESHPSWSPGGTRIHFAVGSGTRPNGTRNGSGS